MGFKKIIYTIAAFLAVLTYSFDIVYALKSPFKNTLLFQVTCIVIGARLLVSQILAQYIYTMKIRNYKPSLGKFQDIADINQDEI